MDDLKLDTGADGGTLDSAEIKADKGPMPDIYEKIKRHMTELDDLLDKVPGLSGYMENQRRREADQIIRKTLVDRLETERLKLGMIYQALSADIVKAIDHAEPLGRVDSRLAGFIGKINDAPVGYSGMFDAIKIDDVELAQLYQYDMGMVGFVDAIADSIAQLEAAVSADSGIATAIHQLSANLLEATTTFNARSELLSGIA